MNMSPALYPFLLVIMILSSTFHTLHPVKVITYSLMQVSMSTE